VKCFQAQKNVVQNTTFHHQITTTSPQKTTQKTLWKPQNPTKTAPTTTPEKKTAKN
jgi:hypothetical protein